MTLGHLSHQDRTQLGHVMLSADKPELTGSIGHTHGNARHKKKSISGTHIIRLKNGLERSILDSKGPQLLTHPNIPRENYLLKLN